MKKLAVLFFAFALFTSLLAAQNCPAGVTHCNILTWSAPAIDPTHDAPTGYRVYRATSCAALTPLPAVYGTTTAAVLTFTDSPTVSGNTFCYGVTAFNSGGESPAAVTQLATTPFQIPGMPAALSVTAK